MNPYPEKKEFSLEQKVIYLYSKNSKWCYFNRNSLDIYNYNIDQSYNFEDREINTIFHGKINSEEKIKYRSNNWKNHIENFSLIFDEFEISQNYYFNILKKSKFGICLKGDSIKSNHLLDYLALGVIPLITSEIDLSFSDNLICGLHYFKINSENDIDEIVKNSSEQHLKLMSEECKKWYLKNCSISGSYNNLLTLLKNLNNIELNINDAENNNNNNNLNNKDIWNIVKNELLKKIYN